MGAATPGGGMCRPMALPYPEVLPGWATVVQPQQRTPSTPEPGSEGAERKGEHIGS